MVRTPLVAVTAICALALAACGSRSAEYDPQPFPQPSEAHAVAAPPDSPDVRSPRGDHLELAELPPPARETIARESAGRELKKLSGHEEYGHVVYDARIARPGYDELQLAVAEDGAVVWRNDLLDQARARDAKNAASGSNAGAEAR